MPDGKPRVRLHWMGRGQWLAAASVHGLVFYGRSAHSGEAIDVALYMAHHLKASNG
jgi:hypothetical protein